MSQEKSKTMPMQIFWGVKEVYYGIVQVGNGITDWWGKQILKANTKKALSGEVRCTPTPLSSLLLSPFKNKEAKKKTTKTKNNCSKCLGSPQESDCSIHPQSYSSCGRTRETLHRTAGKRTAWAYLGLYSGSEATLCMKPIGMVRRNFRPSNLNLSQAGTRIFWFQFFILSRVLHLTLSLGMKLFYWFIPCQNAALCRSSITLKFWKFKVALNLLLQFFKLSKKLHFTSDSQPQIGLHGSVIVQTIHR